MAALYESPWYRLEQIAPDALTLVRTPTPYASLGDLGAAHEPLLAELEARAPRRLLIDLRTAPARNDSDFEDRFQGYRSRLTHGARQTGLLLRTRVGALQVQRLAREDGAEVVVFHEEGEARTWLQHGTPR